MALQINTGLTTGDGGTVASGAYVIFSTTFPYRGMAYSISMNVYRSLDALNGNLHSIKPLEIPQLFFTKTLTLQEYQDLNPVVIHATVKTYLEQYVGAGNVTVILNP